MASACGLCDMDEGSPLYSRLECVAACVFGGGGGGGVGGGGGGGGGG